MSRTEPGTTTLASSKLRMTFDGQGRLTAMEDASGAVKIPIDPGAVTQAFALVLRNASGDRTLVTPQAPPQIFKRPDGLVFRWRVQGTWGRINVAGKVVLPPDAPVAEWTVEVENQTGFALWEVMYPRISGLRDLKGGELAAPRCSGQLALSPRAYGLKGAEFEIWSVHPGPEARLGRLDTHGARQEVAMGPTSVRLWMLKPAQRK